MRFAVCLRGKLSVLTDYLKNIIVNFGTSCVPSCFGSIILALIRGSLVHLCRKVLLAHFLRRMIRRI